MNKTTTLAIDLAKQVFQLHGTDFRGKATLLQKVRVFAQTCHLVRFPVDNFFGRQFSGWLRMLG